MPGLPHPPVLKQLVSLTGDKGTLVQSYLLEFCNSLSVLASVYAAVNWALTEIVSCGRGRGRGGEERRGGGGEGREEGREEKRERREGERREEGGGEERGRRGGKEEERRKGGGGEGDEERGEEIDA